MDELAETELHEATAGLGNWHVVDDKGQYLVNKDECVSCLHDLQIALKHDSPERGNLVHLKLGEWKVLANHLVPLFTSYREDAEISSLVLKVMVQLTTHADLPPSAQMQQIEHLQDYKEAFAKTDVFIILMGMLVETMEEDEEDGVAPQNKDSFDGVFTLLRNLVSVPDPRPGDAGFTPTRRHLQLVYIRHFHDEGVLDFFLLFAEALGADNNTEQAWALGDILYHICTHLDPEELNKLKKEKHKRMLADLLAREQADSRLRMPQASRHSRFGTALQNRTAQGGVSISTSVFQNSQVSKGGSLWRREFRDRDTEKKRSMFHDPFFVDLEEGGVRDHNQLNAHVKNVLDSAKTFSDGVLTGLRKFFEEFMQTSFTTLIGLLRSTLVARAARMSRAEEFNRPKLLNFVSWTLEFHRHHYMAAVQKAREAHETAPVIDIASIQGAIDLDMLQFIGARLREYGKESNIHASHLVVVLRALSQQVKTIALVMESKDSDTRDCGEILTQNIVKDDIMAHLAWIMKNFKTSSHDPRVLSYAVEVFHYMLRLMGEIVERKGSKLEFRVERQHGVRMQQASTTATKEVASLADARVIENLFHLLEKYKRQSAALTSMLVKLIYQIIRVQPTNIVVFFELSYFVRIFRMSSDPLLRDKKMGLQYQEMVSLLQYILRQFFKCAEINGCVFVELLFRKIIQENPKEALLESHTNEFQAILDNYEDEEYKVRILDRIAAGETLEAMRSRQRAALDGNLPWTAEEDAVLCDRYPMYADHPLCAELLAAELPEESHRTARQVKKRLVELGLVSAPRAGVGGGQGGANDRHEVESNADDSQPDLPPALAKKRLLDDGQAGTQVGNSQDSEVTTAKKQRLEALSQRTDEETLEMDLERLLDAAMDGEGDTLMDTAQVGGSQPALDLELELEAMLEEDSTGSTSSQQAPAPAEPAALPGVPATPQVAAAATAGPPTPVATQQHSATPQRPREDGPARPPDRAAASPAGAAAQSAPAGAPAAQPAPPRVGSQSSLQRSGQLLMGSQSGDLEADDSGPGWIQSELDAMLGGGLRSGGSSGSLGAGDSLGDSVPAGLGAELFSSQASGGAAASQPSQRSSQGGLERDLAAVMEDDTTEMRASVPPQAAAASSSKEDDDAQRFWEEAVRGSQGSEAAAHAEPHTPPAAGAPPPAGAAASQGVGGSQQQPAGASQRTPSMSQQLEMDLEMIIDQEATQDPPSGP